MSAEIPKPTVEHEATHNYIWHGMHTRSIEAANSELFRAHVRMINARQAFNSRENSAEERLSGAGHMMGAQSQIDGAMDKFARGHAHYAENLTRSKSQYEARAAEYVDLAIKEATEAKHTINLEPNPPEPEEVK